LSLGAFLPSVLSGRGLKNFERKSQISRPIVARTARWFVEILCKRGLIYPKGGDEVLAFTISTDAWRALLEIGCTAKRVGDKEREADLSCLVHRPCGQAEREGPTLEALTLPAAGA
jgi:hypothetical protein